MEKKNHFPGIMIGTAVVSGVLTVLFLGLYHSLHRGWLESIAVTLLTVFYHFSMRLLVGTFLPDRFDPGASWFQVRPWEQKLYKKLRLRKWKSHIPTYDPSAFNIKKHSKDRLAANMCHAEAVHEVIILCSFLPLLLTIPFGCFGVFLSTSFCAALVDTIFVCLQRYNRPRLLRLIQMK